jgi:hypothetical protein
MSGSGEGPGCASGSGYSTRNTHRMSRQPKQSREVRVRSSRPCPARRVVATLCSAQADSCLRMRRHPPWTERHPHRAACRLRRLARHPSWNACLPAAVFLVLFSRLHVMPAGGTPAALECEPPVKEWLPPAEESASAAADAAPPAKGASRSAKEYAGAVEATPSSSMESTPLGHGCAPPTPGRGPPGYPRLARDAR